MDTMSTTTAPLVRHSPLQSLPSDILWAIHDCCRVKQVGYVLGCACKAFQPTEKTWERYAQRFTFTRGSLSVSTTGTEGVNTTELSKDICNHQTFSGVLHLK